MLDCCALHFLYMNSELCRPLSHPGEQANKLGGGGVLFQSAAWEEKPSEPVHQFNRILLSDDVSQDQPDQLTMAHYRTLDYRICLVIGQKNSFKRWLTTRASTCYLCVTTPEHKPFTLMLMEWAHALINRSGCLQNQCRRGCAKGERDGWLCFADQCCF